jgi:bacterioferritin
MKGNPDVIEVLNGVLCAELTAINQYFIHAKMRDNWGYSRLAKKARDESIDEMKHADVVIGRILFLEGQPNMQKYMPVNVGTTVKEQLQNDLEVEREAVIRLNQAIATCRNHGDNGTRQLLESILGAEESSVDWHESQLHLIAEVGYERYLSEHF